jgi:hypothetical protein
MSALGDAAEREIRALHAHFVSLFTGRSQDVERCAAAFAPGFLMITPEGSSRDRAAVLAFVANAAAPPDFRIDIHEPRIIWEIESAVLLHYVEQQYRDGRTTRRRSSALFTAEQRAPLGVVWQYLHETWMAAPP